MDSDKVNSLISLSNHAYDETKRYRDHVWQVLVWTIGLFVGVLAAAKARPDLANIWWPGSIFIVFVAALGIWDIHFDYKQFILNRNILRKCERILQFYDKNVYGEEEALLP